MAKKMLVDATHEEETRVVITEGNKVEEFDFENVGKLRLAGNIYLAKVKRIEPSLQAAFVDYGGNRHGFLPFSEIHPDYFQIPMADRELSKAEYAEQMERLASETEDEPGDLDEGETDGSAQGDSETDAVSDDDESPETEAASGKTSRSGRSGRRNRTKVDSDVNDVEEAARIRRYLPRRYKIQEVVHVRQILLVQIVKEERGNKGVSLTTYLSLAGRYCVLMPNTPRDGGISRKITNAADRKKLKEIASGIEVPSGAGLIVRTAGAKRNKAEIRRDFEYLCRLWDEIRDLTMQSIAPTLIFEEGGLIQRSIRDLYSREIEEILVEGEEAYKVAKRYMKMLLPSHAKRVKQYKEKLPLFSRYRIEGFLDATLDPMVRLKSGGSIVINSTEALVAIDVNSGRATKKGSVAETALSTNLEAAEELGRQLRLRDLSGLIAIDFIDMNDRRDNAKVERMLKEATKSDRARIQIGSISSFGILEMSRQRLHPGLLESTSVPCPHCEGLGSVRTSLSLGLQVLRRLVELSVRCREGDTMVATVPVDVGNFLINDKRAAIVALEAERSIRVRIEADASVSAAEFSLSRKKPDVDEGIQGATVEAFSLDRLLPGEAASSEDESDQGEAAVPSRRSRRRRRRRGSRGGADNQGTTRSADSENSVEDVEADTGHGDDAAAESSSPDAGIDAGDDAAQPEAGESEAKSANQKSSRRGRRRRSRRTGRSNDSAAVEAGNDGSSDEGNEGDENSVRADGASDPSAEQESVAGEQDSVTDQDRKGSDEGNGNLADHADNDTEIEAAVPEEASIILNDEPLPHDEDDESATVVSSSEEAAPEDAVSQDNAPANARSDEKPRRGWWRSLVEETASDAER